MRIIGMVRPVNFAFGPIRRDVESKRTPGNRFALSSRAIAPASESQGAPISLNGASVPRPSLMLVASKKTVPGYSSAASRSRMLGEGFRQS